MRPMRGSRRTIVVFLAGALALAACSEPAPSPTPYPSGATSAPQSQAESVAHRFVRAWSNEDYAAMWELLAPADRAAHPQAEFSAVFQQFATLARVTNLYGTTDDPKPAALPPEPRPPDLPAPSPTPTPVASGSGAPPAASPSATPSGPPPVLPGPVAGLAVPLHLDFATDLFGDVDLERDLLLTEGANGWQVRWSPALLFPELGDGGSLKLTRTMPERGKIVATDGTVFAENRKDGARIYPQEWLAGQVIGYVSEVTADDLENLAAKGYQAGDVVGRTGLEYGAEDLLRGSPGFELDAVDANGTATSVLTREMVPGADITITIRPKLQALAESLLASHNNGATAAIDPNSGDVWVLASAPRFNPNAMTIGETLDGRKLSRPGSGAILNKATVGTYPGGSSFKPFTLAAALRLGIVDESTRMTCPGTWPFSGFTFRNYMSHSLAGRVTLAQAMAFSCNTTYMPLSVQVYDKNKTALTDLVGEFGFGEVTGIKHLVEAPGILPDAAYFASLDPPRKYGPFDQIQLAIGQGSYLGTPLQLVTAYAAFGNHGTLWVPRIVIQATQPDGTIVEKNEPTVHRRIDLTEKQFDFIIDTLEAVVNLPYGTGHFAFRGFGIQVAGKSGTAETGTPNPHALFPAFAPAKDPRIAVATVLAYMPLGTGGDSSAPLVRQVMARFFASEP